MVHGGAMYHGPVAYRHVVVQNTGRALRLVQAGAVLHIHAVAAAYAVDIGAQHGTIPDTTAVAQVAVAS